MGPLLTTLFLSCGNADKEVLEEMDALRELLQTERTEDMILFHTDSGFLKLKMESPLAINVRDADEPYTEMPKGLYAEFYDREGNIENTIQSEYGISYENRNLVILRNNVEVVNSKQEQLQTEELFWNRETRKIYTDKFVTITTPTETLSGYEMEADEDFSNWIIKKASGKFNLAP